MKKALLACGILASVIYVGACVLGALRWEDYSSFSQTISELMGIDAPSRSVVVPLFLVHDVLLIAFAMGVWATAEGKRSQRTVAWLLVANAAVGMVAAPFAPLHLRGVEATLTDTMHIVFTAVIVVLILLAIGFGATMFGPRFRIYSIATIVMLVVFGTLTSLDGPKIAAQQPTPWMGLWERINVYGYLLWLSVLAAVLLRRSKRAARGWPPPRAVRRDQAAAI